MVIGLTGGIGAGKSTVAGIFKKLGAYIIDADEIARNIMNKGEDAYNEVVSHFGNGILSAGGSVDRKALASIVFGNEAQLKALNEITHKHVFAKMRAELKNCSSDLIVLDVPLLFTCDFPISYDKSVAVIAEEEVRIKRVMARSRLTRKQVLERIGSQLSNSELRRRADYVIENNSDGFEELEEKVRVLYGEIMKNFEVGL